MSSQDRLKRLGLSGLPPDQLQAALQAKQREVEQRRTQERAAFQQRQPPPPPAKA